MNKVYLVKNISGWMIDEVMAMAKITSFTLIILRKPDPVFNGDLEKLKDLGVKVFIRPRNYRDLFKKLVFLFIFLPRIFFKMYPIYNLVIAIESIYWFFWLDLSQIGPKSNIHAQFATQATFIAFLLKKFYNDPELEYSFTYHAYDIYFNNKWFYDLTKNSGNVFSISQFNVNYVNKKYGIKKEIKISRLGSNRDSYVVVRKGLQNPPAIGLVSNFTLKKGIIYLLEAALLLKQRDIRINLTIAGDGPLRSRLSKFVKNNHIDDRVRFVGKLQASEKRSFFSAIDVFVLPCIQVKDDMDGIPVVLMEAISFGIPLISTNVSGIPEICINGENGILINEKDPNAIADSIKLLINNNDLLEKFRKNSKELSSQYDINVNSFSKLKELMWI